MRTGELLCGRPSLPLALGQVGRMCTLATSVIGVNGVIICIPALVGWGGVGGGLSLAKTSTSSASPPESTGPCMARADYLTFATRRKMKCYRERCLSL